MGPTIFFPFSPFFLVLCIFSGGLYHKTQVLFFKYNYFIAFV